MSSSLHTGNVVTFDTTDLNLPTDLVVWWSIRFGVTLDRLTVRDTLRCYYDNDIVSYVYIPCDQEKRLELRGRSSGRCGLIRYPSLSCD
jgi:hypothetical protein